MSDVSKAELKEELGVKRGARDDDDNDQASEDRRE